MKTYIEVVETSIIGWSSGAPATKNFFPFDFTPDKPLSAYEYVDLTETRLVPAQDDPENSTVEETLVVGKTVRVREGWNPEISSEEVEEESTP